MPPFICGSSATLRTPQYSGAHNKFAWAESLGTLRSLMYRRVGTDVVHPHLFEMVRMRVERMTDLLRAGVDAGELIVLDNVGINLFDGVDYAALEKAFKRKPRLTEGLPARIYHQETARMLLGEDAKQGTPETCYSQLLAPRYEGGSFKTLYVFPLTDDSGRLLFTIQRGMT